MTPRIPASLAVSAFPRHTLYSNACRKRALPSSHRVRLPASRRPPELRGTMMGLVRTPSTLKWVEVPHDSGDDRGEGTGRRGISGPGGWGILPGVYLRSEEHTSELQS